MSDVDIEKLVKELNIERSDLISGLYFGSRVNYDMKQIFEKIDQYHWKDKKIIKTYPEDFFYKDGKRNYKGRSNEEMAVEDDVLALAIAYKIAKQLYRYRKLNKQIKKMHCKNRDWEHEPRIRIHKSMEITEDVLMSLCSTFEIMYYLSNNRWLTVRKKIGTSTTSAYIPDGIKSIYKKEISRVKFQLHPDIWVSEKAHKEIIKGGSEYLDEYKLKCFNSEHIFTKLDSLQPFANICHMGINI